MHMQPGDVLLVYTDGVTEAWDQNDEMYEVERMQSVIQKNDTKTPADMVIALFDDIYRFIGKTRQSDDITCFIVKIH